MNHCYFMMSIQGKEANCKAFVSRLTDMHFPYLCGCHTVGEGAFDGEYSIDISGFCMRSVGFAFCTRRENSSTLQEESEQLSLIIDVCSTESCYGFAEHYEYWDGDLLDASSVDYQEVYWNREDYPTLEDFNAAYGTSCRQDDFDMYGFVGLGGFANRSFAKLYYEGA